jgi:hypothetical protein
MQTFNNSIPDQSNQQPKNTTQDYPELSQSNSLSSFSLNSESEDSFKLINEENNENNNDIMHSPNNNYNYSDDFYEAPPELNEYQDIPEHIQQYISKDNAIQYKSFPKTLEQKIFSAQKEGSYKLRQANKKYKYILRNIKQITEDTFTRLAKLPKIDTIQLKTLLIIYKQRFENVLYKYYNHSDFQKYDNEMQVTIQTLIATLITSNPQTSAPAIIHKVKMAFKIITKYVYPLIPYTKSRFTIQQYMKNKQEQQDIQYLQQLNVNTAKFQQPENINNNINYANNNNNNLVNPHYKLSNQTNKSKNANKNIIIINNKHKPSKLDLLFNEIDDKASKHQAKHCKKCKQGKCKLKAHKIKVFKNQ